MRALVCQSYSGPNGLKLEEVEMPTPSGNQILMKIEAAGIGYVDALMVAGKYQIKPKLPYVPGNEISGTIVSAGETQGNLKVGQRILATSSSGGLAEFATVDTGNCVPIPDTFQFNAAAGFLVNYCTALYGFRYCGQLRPEENVLILGGSGGVGLAAIDCAKALGARVIAAASTEEKRDACRKAGADFVLDYEKEDWRNDIRSILGSAPLDMVYDPVGGKYAEPSLRSLGPGGRFLVVGFASGEIPSFPANLTLLKRCSVIGVNWGGHIAQNPGTVKEVISKLIDWVLEGRIKPREGQVFKLEDAPIAMQQILERKAIGKVVVNPNN